MTDAGVIPLELTPRIPLNRSYFDASSAEFFARRTVRIRGTREGERLVARTLWPEDFRLSKLPPLRPLPSDRPVALSLRQRMRADPRGGAQSPFAAATLWRRTGAGDDLGGRAVIGVMANGAQGDDDEAHAGHFALVTGRVRDDGAIGDWLVNNFYTLDSESEKGILAAPVPLDNYLADLNAGQGWYRPSYMLVAVLARDRAALLLEAALGRLYNQFWRHQIVYYHPTTNCTSLSIDALDALGIRVARRGPTSRLSAILGFPWLLAKERSVDKAMQGVDYLWTEQTRMLPAAAFEEIGARLLALATQTRTARDDRSALSTMLAADLDALVYLQFPQFPSSRAWGDAPVATLREYRQRLPQDPSRLKIVPVPARPFPRALHDPDLLSPPVPASERIAAFWAIISLVGIPWLIRRARLRRQARWRAFPPR